MAIPIALQLYTVREEAARDFPGTLRQVADIGYAGVELAGYGGMEVGALRERLKSLGLAVAGSHVALARLETDLGNVIADCYTLECETVVCPVLPAEQRNEQGFRALARTLNVIGGTLHTHGLAFCYHNHAFEFETTIDGQRAYDWLIANTNPAYVGLEIDVYWLRKAGHDPAAYLHKNAGRIPLVHLKDMTADAEQTFAPVGTGAIDFAPIFAAAELGGAAWYIVEQDRSAGTAIEAARTSWENLRAMGKV